MDAKSLGTWSSTSRTYPPTRLAGELLHLQLVFPFFDQIKLIGLNVTECLTLSAGPCDLDTFYAGSFAETEIGTEIALGKIAASAGDLADLRQPASHNAKACSHRVAVTLGSNEFEIEEMIPITAAIMQQQGRVSIVGYDHVHEPIIIEIGKSNASADMGCLKASTGQLGSLYELAVPFIVKQRVDLLIVNLRGGLFDFGIDVAISNEQVQPFIVVVIEKAPTKAEHVARGARDAGLITDFVEKSLAVVMPEMV